MPVTEIGVVRITAPPAGTEVIGGSLLIEGFASPGLFENPTGTVVRQLPPLAVTVSVDGAPPQPATQRTARWARWDANLQVPPGPHTIIALARGAGWTSEPHEVNVLSVAPQMTIVGVEQTQSIQVFPFNNQGSDFNGGANNSVPLVAQKSTMLRVYVASVPGQPQPNVSGELIVGSDALLPSNGPIPARPANTIQRGQFNDTLNFLLPASMCVGTVSGTIRVFDPARPGPRLNQSESQVSLTFGPVPPLRVHGVLVHYTGGGLDITAPSEEDFNTTLRPLSSAGPISEIVPTGFTVQDFADNLVPAPPPGGSGCGSGWDSLLRLLRKLQGANTEIYIALLPTPGVPTGGVIGCGGGGRVAAAFRGNGFLMAQEVGHALNRSHAPCPTTTGPDVDATYPTFLNLQTRVPFPPASIGEFGLDLATQSVLDPATHRDFMGQCNPKWISPYTYSQLQTAILSLPTALAGSSEMRDTPAEHLYLDIRVHREGRVEVLPSFHLHGPAPIPGNGTMSPVECDLIGANGEAVASHRFERGPLQNPDAAVVEYHGALPWDPSARAIVFRRQGQPIFTHNIEEVGPGISIDPPTFVDRRPQQVRIDWTVEAPPDVSLEHLLRYSHDDGATWRGVAAGLTEPGYVVDLDLLPGGERCRLEAAVTSGIRTAVAATPPFAVPKKPVHARIVTPSDDTVIARGDLLHLSGIGFSPDSGSVAFEDMLWFSDRDGLLDIGPDIFTTSLSPGRHQLELTVLDGQGGEATATVSVEVTPRRD